MIPTAVTVHLSSLCGGERFSCSFARTDRNYITVQAAGADIYLQLVMGVETLNVHHEQKSSMAIIILAAHLSAKKQTQDNLSWFGFPEDTVPSARATLLPGIIQARLYISIQLVSCPRSLLLLYRRVYRYSYSLCHVCVPSSRHTRLPIK
jgi:hypothetical protein